MAPDAKALRKQLKGVASPAVLDAVLQRHGHAAHLGRLVSPTPGEILFGRAVTMQYRPIRNDLRDDGKNSFAAKFYEGVGDEPHDDKVLVMVSGGHPQESLGGGTKLSRLQNHGLAGLVSDSHLRDFHELAEYDFVSYCRGETAQPGDGVVMPWSVNAVVSFAGVTVAPGDWIYADEHGAVVIPGSDVEGVVSRAAELEEEDAEWIRRIRDEDPKVVVAKGSGEK